MQKKRVLCDRQQTKSFSLRIIFLPKTRNKSLAKKLFFISSGARQLLVKLSLVLCDACWGCHKNTRRVHFTAFCFVYAVRTFPPQSCPIPHPPPASIPRPLEDNNHARRLVRQPLTPSDSPVTLCVGRAACPKPKSRAGASTPVRLVDTIPPPLLGRFHLFQAKTIRRRSALNALTAAI